MTVNNAKIILDQTFSSQATSITLPAGTGAILGDSFPLKITYEFFDYNKNVISREILNITSRSGDTIQVQRAVEKCPVSDFVFTQTQTPQELKKGGILEVRVTAGELDGKANDSNVVHKTGDEEIDGVKTFKKQIKIDIDNSFRIMFQNGGKDRTMLGTVNTSKIGNDNMCIYNYTDDGSYLGRSFTVIRSNGNVQVGKLFSNTADAGTDFQVIGDSYFSDNVGIGTTNPSEKLEVHGNTKINGHIEGFCSKTMPVGYDLNNLTTSGFYTISQSANRPSGSPAWGYIEVLKRYLGSDVYVKQEYTQLTGANKKWFRIYNGSGWNAWTLIAG